VLVQLDSILLAETDSDFVGEPGGMVAHADGTLLIADKRNGTLHEFDRHGAHLRDIGQRGQGPNEWAVGPHVVFSDSDTLIVAADGLGRLKGVALPSGVQQWDRATAPGRYLIGVHRGAAMLVSIDRGTRSTLAQLAVLGDTAITSGGPYPSILDANQFVGELFSAAAVTWLGADSIVMALQSSNNLFVGPFPLGPFDTIPVPVLARRGALPELLRQIDENDTRTIERAIYQPSYPLALARLPSSGLLALVSADQNLVDGSRMTGKLFLSLIDRTSGRVCPDAPVSTPADPLPHVTFLGDTLLVLIQAVDQEQTRSVVRRFLPNADDCRWIGAER
jgi:hypothetical protein